MEIQLALVQVLEPIIYEIIIFLYLIHKIHPESILFFPGGESIYGKPFKVMKHDKVIIKLQLNYNFTLFTHSRGPCTIHSLNLDH